MARVTKSKMYCYTIGNIFKDSYGRETMFCMVGSGLYCLIDIKTGNRIKDPVIYKFKNFFKLSEIQGLYFSSDIKGHKLKKIN